MLRNKKGMVASQNRANVSKSGEVMDDDAGIVLMFQDANDGHMASTIHLTALAPREDCTPNLERREKVKKREIQVEH